MLLNRRRRNIGKLRKIAFHGYMTTFITNFLILAFGMVNSVLLARSLGPTGRGEVAAAILWPTLLSYIGNFGIADAILYFGSQKNEDVNAIFTNGLLAACLQTILILPLAFLTLPLLLSTQTSEVIYLARLSLLIIPMSLVNQYITSILRAYMHLNMFNIKRLLIPIGSVLIVCVLYFVHAINTRNVVISLIVLNGLSLVLAVIMILVLAGFSVRVTLDASLMHRMGTYGLKVHLGTVSGTANQRIDQSFIAALLPPRDLGLYVVAVNTANLMLMLPQAINMVMTPSIARLETEEMRITQLKKTVQEYWLLSLALAVGLMVVLPWGIPLIYGAEFKESVPLSELLLVGAVLLGIRTVLTGGAQALGNPLLPSRAEAAAVIITLVGLPLFIPWIGILGASLISIVAYFCSALIILVGLRHYELQIRDLLSLNLSYERARQRIHSLID